jgi:X-Pro dipeptidyl-peptidase
VDDVAFSGAVLAAADSDNHRLLYATPELREPVHLSGTARIAVRLASSKPAANLSVWLVVLPWAATPTVGEPIVDGTRTANLITRGWADPQNYRSLTRGEALVPGRFYTMTFALQPDDQVIPAGKRIGLMIFSSDRDFTLWPQAGTQLTVDLDATSIALPVVGGNAALRKAFEQPDR